MSTRVPPPFLRAPVAHPLCARSHPGRLPAGAPATSGRRALPAGRARASDDGAENAGRADPAPPWAQAALDACPLLPGFDTALPAWCLPFRREGAETVSPAELVVEGTLPADLDVTIFRNGPSALFGKGHIFDGRAQISALSLSRGKATFRCRPLVTAADQEEEAAGRPLWGGFGHPLPHGPLTLLSGRSYKSPANTHMMFHAGRLFALGEGGLPERLDPLTLESLGPSDLGALAQGEGFCAHTKRAAADGEHLSLGFRFAWSNFRLRAHMRVLALAGGVAREVSTCVLPLAATVHDFLATPRRVVVAVGPLAMRSIPMAWICGMVNLSQAMHWLPWLGTQIYSLDLASGQMRHSRAPAMLPLHTVNAWDEGDDTIFDLCDGEHPDIGLIWGEVVKGRLPPSRLPLVKRFRLGADGALEALAHPPVRLEFPMVDPRYVGERHRFVFGLTWEAGAHLFGTPARLDVTTGELVHAALPPGAWAGECLPIAKGGADRVEGDVWLACEVSSAVDDTCEAYILDGADLAAGPVARLFLPQPQSFRFHGVVVDNKDLPPIVVASPSPPPSPAA